MIVLWQRRVAEAEDNNRAGSSLLFADVRSAPMRRGRPLCAAAYRAFGNWGRRIQVRDKVVADGEAHMLADGGGRVIEAIRVKRVKKA